MVLLPRRVNPTGILHKKADVLFHPHRNLSYQRRPPQPSSEITKLLQKYESVAPRPLNLGELLSFAHPVIPESVLSSVSYALSELPRRLSTRVRSLEALPFIVGTNPYVTRTLEAYKESFQFLATHPQITTLEENRHFVEQLAALVQRHANDIPTMAKGCVILLHS
jgi:26S proteasome regulatory subunit T1